LHLVGINMTSITKMHGSMNIKLKKNYFSFFCGELAKVCELARNWIMQRLVWGKSA